MNDNRPLPALKAAADMLALVEKETAHILKIRHYVPLEAAALEATVRFRDLLLKKLGAEQDNHDVEKLVQEATSLMMQKVRAVLTEENEELTRQLGDLGDGQKS